MAPAGLAEISRVAALLRGRWLVLDGEGNTSAFRASSRAFTGLAERPGAAPNGSDRGRGRVHRGGAPLREASEGLAECVMEDPQCVSDAKRAPPRCRRRAQSFRGRRIHRRRPTTAGAWSWQVNLNNRFSRSVTRSVADGAHHNAWRTWDQRRWYTVWLRKYRWRVGRGGTRWRNPCDGKSGGGN